jgi:GGDEF domain-containing protein
MWKEALRPMSGLEVENDALRRQVRELEEALDGTTSTTANLRALAYEDPLTGLPNRRFLNDSFKRILSTRRGSKRLAVLFIDLDDFKHVNDSFGHRFADGLLREVAVRLEAVIRFNDILSAPGLRPLDRCRPMRLLEMQAANEDAVLSRLGGDEFVILLPEVRDPAVAGSVALRIIERIGQPFTAHHCNVLVTASVGIALYPTDGQTADTLIENADAAMYRAKQNGKARYEHYGVAADAAADRSAATAAA